jgi:hypothetical protein
VKDILRKIHTPSVTINILTANNGLISYTETVTAFDVDSYESALMLNTGQGERKIDYRSIFSISEWIISST